MNNFEFCVPTQFVFGRDTETRAGDLIQAYGGKKTLVLYGTSSAKKSGLLDRVLGVMDQANLDYEAMGGISANPRLTFVREAIKKVSDGGFDFILAIGGGSVLDTAKAVAVGIACEKHGYDFWEYLFDGKIFNYDKVAVVGKDVLPVGVILTLVAAGSEGGDSAVVMNDELPAHPKIALHGGRPMRPVFSIMNPELTFTTSAYQTASGVSDMMSHIIERYFTNTTDVELTDGMSESLLRTIIRAGRVAVAKPDDYAARADLMWAGMLAHCDLLSCGRIPDFGAHPMELRVSGGYDTTHGAGLAVILPAYMAYNVDHNVARGAKFAREVFGISDADPRKAALEGIALLKEYYVSLGLPASLRDMGVPKEDIPRLAEQTIFYNGGVPVGNYAELNEQDCVKIFESCW